MCKVNINILRDVHRSGKYYLKNKNLKPTNDQPMRQNYELKK